MSLTDNAAPARHALLVEHLQEYLSAKRRSARWLGLTVARDARLLPNLMRGQDYPAHIMLALSSRLLAFYEDQLAQEQTVPARAA